MTARAYYNEIDSNAAAWLRNLIAAGQIAPGEVDERSIADVRPDDLLGYVQCHFFAGVGVWSYALRRAGWDDQRPVWTGSCPCQPFSAAGRGEGFADERHLWPAFHHLIAQRRPPVVFGEQVASKAVDPWIDLVQDDMEGLGYAFGAVPFPSAGVGAPHIRDRAYFVAHTAMRGREHEPRAGRTSVLSASPPDTLAGAELSRLRASAGRLADASGEPGQRIAGSIPRSQGQSGGRCDYGHRSSGAACVVDHALGAGLEGQRGGHQAAFGHGEGSVRPVAEAGELGRLAVPHGGQRGEGGHLQRHQLDGQQPRDGSPVREGSSGLGHNGGPELARPGPTNGFWRDPDWLHCRDGRWRPVEPGTFPLAHGAPARVGRLRAYGNAINAEAAAAFIAASLDVMAGVRT